MTQKGVLRSAVDALIDAYSEKITDFSLKDFLKSRIDPFGFRFNVEILGLNKAIRREIEHKMEMVLEDLFGNFHEDYLGRAVHLPSSTQWSIVPQGEIPGIDIANFEKDWYLQIKSKHNSMNSSSSKRLAQELRELKLKKPNAIIGCGWVVAGPSVKCIGEEYIRNVAAVLKGRDLYGFVTGNNAEMDEVLEDFPGELARNLANKDLDTLLEAAASRIATALIAVSERDNKGVAAYLYQKALA